MKQKIIITGGTGFLGQCIVNALSKNNYDIVVLSRTKNKIDNNVNYIKWDGKTLGAWSKELEGSSIVINLAGRSVDCRYNKKNKKVIVDSRVDATHIIGEAIKSCNNPPKLWINAGSATIYRNTIDKPMDEATGEYGSGFSVEVCKKWEETFNNIVVPNTRKVCLRISIVLGLGGGVIPIMTKLARLGLGGTQGRGNQYISWLHETDFLRIIKWVIDHEEIEGTYNCSAPNPIQNAPFMKLIRSICGVKIGLPAKRWMLEIGAIFLRTETELILKSRRVVPQKFLDSGFEFRYPTVGKALDNLITRQ